MTRTLVQRVCLGDARDVSYVTNAERLSPLRLELTLIRIIIDRASSTVCHLPFVLNRFPNVIQRQHFVDASAPSVVYTPVLTICR